MEAIKPGDEFEWRKNGGVCRFRREADNENTNGYKMTVTCLSDSMNPKRKPSTFDTEAEWFVQRGLVAAE